MQQQLQQQQQNLQNLQQMLLLQSGQLAPNIQAMLLQNQGMLQLRQSLQALTGTQGLSLPQDTHSMQPQLAPSQQRDGLLKSSSPLLAPTSLATSINKHQTKSQQQHSAPQTPTTMSHMTKAHLTNQALIKQQQQQNTIDQQSSPLWKDTLPHALGNGNNNPAMRGHNDPSPEEMTDLEELEQFAKTFKQRRIKLGKLLP